MYCRIRGFIETVKRCGLNVYHWYHGPYGRGTGHTVIGLFVVL